MCEFSLFCRAQEEDEIFRMALVIHHVTIKTSAEQPLQRVLCFDSIEAEFVHRLFRKRGKSHGPSLAATFQYSSAIPCVAASGSSKNLPLGRAGLRDLGLTHVCSPTLDQKRKEPPNRGVIFQSIRKCLVGSRAFPRRFASP